MATTNWPEKKTVKQLSVKLKTLLYRYEQQIIHRKLIVVQISCVWLVKRGSSMERKHDEEVILQTTFTGWGHGVPAMAPKCLPCQ